MPLSVTEDEALRAQAHFNYHSTDFDDEDWDEDAMDEDPRDWDEEEANNDSVDEVMANAEDFAGDSDDEEAETIVPSQWIAGQ